MLSKILEKSTCAECRFCCSFRRGSLWETPLFTHETAKKLSNTSVKFVEKEDKGCKYAQMDLTGKYTGNDENEEAACEFLDSKRGCVLSDEDKPFDCKIWPLRIMRKGEKLVIALTPTCPSINRRPLSEVKSLVEEGLGDKIYEYALEYPFIIKEYKEGFEVLKEYDVKA